MELTDSTEIADGIYIYHPIEGDQSSYDVFPCVPYINMVQKIEMRENSLAGGFCMKEEYRNLHLNEYGAEW